MTWLLPVLAMVVIALVAGLLTGRIGGAGLGEPETSLPPRGLRDGDVDSAAVRGVRFNLALRGYRMSEVDETLERLAAELERRDAELAELRGTGAPADRADLADPAEPSYRADLADRAAGPDAPSGPGPAPAPPSPYRGIPVGAPYRADLAPRPGDAAAGDGSATGDGTD